MICRPSKLAPVVYVIDSHSDEDKSKTSGHRFIQGNLRRNIIVQLGHGAFGQTGFRLIAAPTFIPAYLFSITGSDVLVGLTRAFQAFGTVLSPFIGASLIGHRKKILGITVAVSVLMRLQVFGLALAGFFLGQQALVPATIVLLTLIGFFQGMSQVQMQSLRAKVIPTDKRGIVTGARNSIAGICSAIVSYIAGAFVLQQNLLGNGYASIFLMAFVIASIGVFVLCFTKEPRADSVRIKESFLGTLRSIPDLIRQDPAFGRFFIARAFGSFGRMALPFYVLYAGMRMELDGLTLGVLTTVWMITSSTANLFWGLIADRKGYRLVMIITLAIWTLSHIQLLYVETLNGMIVFFVLMGIPSGGFNQSGQNMVLEFGKNQDIPLRLAASGSAVNLIGAIGPLIGGAIAAIYSYEVLFISTIVLQGIGLIGLIKYVPEPRLRVNL